MRDFNAKRSSEQNSCIYQDISLIFTKQMLVALSLDIPPILGQPLSSAALIIYYLQSPNINPLKDEELSITTIEQPQIILVPYEKTQEKKEKSNSGPRELFKKAKVKEQVGFKNTRK